MLAEISTGASNQIQAFIAKNSFQTAKNALSNNNNSKRIEDNTPSGVDLKDNHNILKDQNISEIRNFAKIVGENNLTDEDIKYGLTYGRSVIADYVI